MKVGDKVKVLAIPDWLLLDIPQDGLERLNGQLDKVVEIRGIQDEEHLWLAFTDGTEGFALERQNAVLMQESSNHAK